MINTNNNTTFSFFQKSQDFTITNIIIYFVLPIRILSDNLPLIPTIMNLFLIMLIAIDMLYATARKKEILCFMWIFVATTVGYVLACHFQKNYIYPIRGYIRYGTYFLLFLYFSNHKVCLKDLFNVYTFLVTIQIILCLIQDFILHQRFSNGSLQNRNHVCYFIAFYLSLCLFEFRKIKRAFFLFLFELYLGGMGGALAATMLLFCYYVLDIHGKKKILHIFLFVFVIILGILALWARIVEAIQSFGLLSERLKTGNVGSSSSILWRIVTWFNMCKQMHVDAGVGIGAGIEYGSLVSPYFCSASLLDPHNDYVRLYIESGFLGLAIVLFGIIYSTKKLKLKSEKSLNKACFYFELSFLICMTVANLIVQSTLLWFYFSFLGQINSFEKNKDGFNEKNSIGYSGKK